MSKFRTIELSDPRFEFEHLRLLTFKSPALKARGDVTIFVPPSCEAATSVPLILLLHGVYGSHWAWTWKGGAHRTALELIETGSIKAVVLAMPSDGLWGDGSGYVSHQAADYERWIVEDVVDCVTEVVPCVNAESPLFIAGQSMGGYGALRLGAKYAPKFRGVSVHSSITHPSQLSRFVEEPLLMYGAALQQEDADVLYWMWKNGPNLPPLRFDCGTSDELIEVNRKLHRDLELFGVRHQYQEFEGEHTWDYWQEHLSDTLLFFESICRNNVSSGG